MATRRGAPRMDDFSYEGERYLSGNPDFDYRYDATPYQAPTATPPQQNLTQEPPPGYGAGTGSFTGFESSKMNTDHAAKSPKYAFQDVFKDYSNSQEGLASGFKTLQERYPDFFGGWELDGDKIFYRGEGGPHDAFKGITGFDIQVDTEGGGPWAWQPLEGFGYYPEPQGGGGMSMPSFNFPSGGGSSGGSIGGGGSTGGATSGPMFGEEVMENLRKLFPDGLYNDEIVNRRTENAADTLRRFDRSRRSNNRAILADRGLIGSGPEFTEMFEREGDIADQYSQAVSGIYSDESENADSRMMNALQIAAGLTSEEARLLVDQFRAQTDRDLGFGNIGLGYHRANQDFSLGQGNLALGNMRAVNDYNLGLGQFGLNRDLALWQMEQGGIDNLLRILDMYQRGAGQSAGGYR